MDRARDEWWLWLWCALLWWAAFVASLPFQEAGVFGQQCTRDGGPEGALEYQCYGVDAIDDVAFVGFGLLVAALPPVLLYAWFTRERGTTRARLRRFLIGTAVIGLMSVGIFLLLTSG